MKTKLITLLLLFIPIIAWAEASPTPAPDKLQSALADMVNKSVQVAGDAKDFLVAQLPDVIRQLLAWKMAEAAIWFIATSAVFFFGLKYLIRLSRFFYREYVPEGFILVVLGGIAVIVSAGLALSHLMLVLQIWIAPKIYLIEYSEALITGH